MSYRLLLAIITMLLISNFSSAATTTRISQFSNKHVAVWETTIYPNAKHVLKMHRHDNDRVLIALDAGMLKITNDKHRIHYLKVSKNKAYYLKKDILNEFHQDENISNKPLKFLVVELR